jgi:hypothetical protein
MLQSQALNILLILFATSCSTHGFEKENEVEIPKWMYGIWSNSASSDLDDVATFFVNKSYFSFEIGDPEQDTFPPENYFKGISSSRSDNFVFDVLLVEDNDSISFSFELIEAYDSRVLLWSYSVNGIETKQRSKDISSVLFHQKGISDILSE